MVQDPIFIAWIDERNILRNRIQAEQFFLFGVFPLLPGDIQVEHPDPHEIQWQAADRRIHGKLFAVFGEEVVFQLEIIG